VSELEVQLLLCCESGCNCLADQPNSVGGMLSLSCVISAALVVTGVALFLSIVTLPNVPSQSSLRFVRSRTDILAGIEADLVKAVPTANASANYLNDDYCDTATGTDEPMTSACAGHKAAVFVCRRDMRTIPSSRVQDGDTTIMLAVLVLSILPTRRMRLL
jgi:hypothetical protein